MLMTMGVLNKHENKHEFITLRQRQLYGITVGIEGMQFSNDKGKKNLQHTLFIINGKKHIMFYEI